MQESCMKNTDEKGKISLLMLISIKYWCGNGHFITSAVNISDKKKGQEIV